MSVINKITSGLKSQWIKAKLFNERRPRRAPVIFGAAGLALILGISFLIALVMYDGQPAPSATAQITITENGFIPASLVVKKGTKIIWTNTDQAKHQLQANPHPTGDSLPGLKSEILNNSQTYEYVAGEEGTFGYHDHLNPTTNGTIDVQD